MSDTLGKARWVRANITSTHQLKLHANKKALLEMVCKTLKLAPNGSALELRDRICQKLQFGAYAPKPEVDPSGDSGSGASAAAAAAAAAAASKKPEQAEASSRAAAG